MTIETAALLRRCPTHLLRHYPSHIAGRKYKQLERWCKEKKIAPTWADIEYERGRRHLTGGSAPRRERKNQSGVFGGAGGR